MVTRPRYRFGDVQLGPQPQTYNRARASPPGVWVRGRVAGGPTPDIYRAWGGAKKRRLL
eukprot:gene21442-biopygen11667